MGLVLLAAPVILKAFLISKAKPGFEIGDFSHKLAFQFGEQSVIRFNEVIHLNFFKVLKKSIDNFKQGCVGYFGLLKVIF